MANAIVHGLGVAATNDKRAVREWTQHYDLSPEIIASLSDLRPGEAWVLSPEVAGVRRVQVDRRRTFDSGATPTVGSAIRRPRTLADIDAGAIKEALAEAIERAEADDPKVLRRRITELERQLDRMAADFEEALAAAVADVKPREVRVFDEPLLIRLEAALTPATGLMADLQELLRWKVEDDGEDALTFTRIMRDDLPRAGVPVARPVPPPPPPAPRRVPATPRREPDDGDVNVKLGGPERKILTLLAQHPDGRTKAQTAMLCGYAERSKGFTNPLGKLRSAGYVVGTAELRITREGLEALGAFEPLPSGPDLIDYWMDQLGGPEQALLRVLVDDWPATLTVEELAARTRSSRGEAYAPRSKGFTNPLGRLRTLGLVVGDRSALRAADLLFTS